MVLLRRWNLATGCGWSKRYEALYGTCQSVSYVVSENTDEHKRKEYRNYIRLHTLVQHTITIRPSSMMYVAQSVTHL